jgi:hypothetical protein
MSANVGRMPIGLIIPATKQARRARAHANRHVSALTRELVGHGLTHAGVRAGDHHDLAFEWRYGESPSDDGVVALAHVAVGHVEQ